MVVEMEGVVFILSIEYSMNKCMGIGNSMVC